jgi:hypothetical protein
MLVANHHHHHHHHISVTELGQLLTRSGLTYPEVSSKLCHVSFCQLGNSVSLPWVIYYEAFHLHVVSSFSCIPVICPKSVLFLIPLQFVYLTYWYFTYVRKLIFYPNYTIFLYKVWIWFRHVNVAVFLYLTHWRWPHDRPKHVDG